MPVKTSAGTGAARARRTANKRTATPSRAAKQASPVKTAKPAATRPAATGKPKRTVTPAAKVKKAAPEKSVTAAKPPKAKTAKKKPPRRVPRKVDATPPDAEVVAAESMAAEPDSAPPAGQQAKTKRKPVPKPNSLVQKVLRTINGELTKLDEHTGNSSQDRERASRALSQMVTSLEKAVGMQRQIERDKGSPNGAKDKEVLRHAEDLRRQIAERLERLNRQRNGGRGAEGADGG